MLTETDEWLTQRLGRFTCSRFGDIMPRPKARVPWTQTAFSYVYQIAAERCGSYSLPISSASTDWGLKHEQLALELYSDMTFRKSDETIGSTYLYIEHGTQTFRPYGDHAGGSPDAVVSKWDRIVGTVEVKCPYDPATHMRNVHTRLVPTQYEWQVQGHMLVTGAEWCDFVSYDPRITSDEHRMSIVRVHRDEAVMEKMHARLEQADELVRDILKGVVVGAGS